MSSDWFRGYEDWQIIAASHNGDKIAMILGNPAGVVTFRNFGRERRELNWLRSRCSGGLAFSSTGRLVRILRTIVGPPVDLMATFNAQFSGRGGVRCESVRCYPFGDEAIFLQKLAHEFQRSRLVFGLNQDLEDFTPPRRRRARGRPCVPRSSDTSHQDAKTHAVLVGAFVILRRSSVRSGSPSGEQSRRRR
jgi:hypothetical protein